jgi:putative transposase
LSASKTLAEVAAVYNLHPVQVCQWKRQVAKRLPELFHPPETGDCTNAGQDVRLQLTRLEEANAALEKELDWLKKKFYSYDQGILRSLLEPDHPDISIRRQCELLGASRSTYYYRPVSVDQKTRDLARHVDVLCADRPLISSRDLVVKLHSCGFSLCRNTLCRLLSRMGFAPFERNLIKRYRAHLAQASALPFRLDDAMTHGGQWILDIAYWPSLKEERFAALLIDRHSLRCLGWGLAGDLVSSLPVGVCMAAVDGYPLPLTLHCETLLPLLNQRFLQEMRQRGIGLVGPLWLDLLHGSGRATSLLSIWRVLKQKAGVLRLKFPQATEEWVMGEAINAYHQSLNTTGSSSVNGYQNGCLLAQVVRRDINDPGEKSGGHLQEVQRFIAPAPILAPDLPINSNLLRNLDPVASPSPCCSARHHDSGPRTMDPSIVLGEVIPSPGQNLSIRMPKGPRILQCEFIDPCQEATHRHIGIHGLGIEAHHPGAHQARVEEGDSYAVGLEVDSEGFAGHVQCRFRHAVAVRAARAVVADGAHPACDDRHLRSWGQMGEHGPGEPQRPQGIHLELPPQAFKIQWFQACGFQNAGVEDQAINRQSIQAGQQASHRRRTGHVHAGGDPHAQGLQLRRGHAAGGDHALPARLELTAKLQADAPIASRDQIGFHPKNFTAYPFAHELVNQCAGHPSRIKYRLVLVRVQGQATNKFR